MAHPIFRVIVMVVFALCAIAIGVFGILAVRDGHVLGGILCFPVALAALGFSVYDAWRFVQARK